ncbi:24308_t:CDS:1, partial [Gigaspora rosea]
FSFESAKRAQKWSNFLLTEKIVDLIKTKNITLELNKVADKLAKKGCEVSETIQVEVGESSRFQNILFWKN